MNLQQLRYAVEVEKTSSITQAAKNLYMGQPNLSKSIKELEQDLGITIFTRNAKGVEPTSMGLQFLRYAHEILDKVDELSSLFQPQHETTLRFSVSLPRATYASVAFANFINRLDRSRPLDILCRETNSLAIVGDVSVGTSVIGVLRYQDIYESYFLNLLKKNNLQYQVLWEYRMMLLVHKSHPLAECTDVPYERLQEYTEIIHGDFQVPALPPAQMKQLTRSDNRIFIYDRGSQFDLLERVKGTYLWVSPLPQEVLDQHDMVQLKCSGAGIHRDLVIYHQSDGLEEYERQFIEELKQEVAFLDQSIQ